MKHKDLLKFWEGLNSVGHFKGVKFAYAVCRNRAMVKSIIDSLEDSFKPSEEFVKWDAERLEIARKYARKDEQGNLIEMPGRNLDITNMPAFIAEIDLLKEKYQEALDAREKQMAEKESLMSEEVQDFKPYMLPFSQIPEDMTVEHMDKIIWMLEEPKA
jgi:hypothetical protein